MFIGFNPTQTFYATASSDRTENKIRNWFHFTLQVSTNLEWRETLRINPFNK